MSKHKSFTLEELAKATDAEIVGDSQCIVDNIATISNANDTSITFLSNKKYTDSLKHSKACCVIVAFVLCSPSVSPFVFVLESACTFMGSLFPLLFQYSQTK